MLVAANKKKYDKHVYTTKKGGNILYTLLGKVLYGCLKSARLFWEHLRKVLTRLGFTLNQYDSCVANKNFEGDQCTITWYVDDLKISHRSLTVATEVIISIESMYGKMTVTCGDCLKKVLKRLGFTLNQYDSCVVNKNFEGDQCTVTWHVDD